MANASSSTSTAPIKIQQRFSNSFWGNSYSSGYGRLINRMENGLVENEQTIRMIQNRAPTFKNPENLNQGFASDNISSLGTSFLALRAMELEYASNQRELATNLNVKIIEPFSQWLQGHAGRVKSCSREVGISLDDYENKLKLVLNLKGSYDTARRAADDAENEAQFDGKPSTSTPVSPSASIVQDEPIDSEDDVPLVKAYSALQSLSRGMSTRIKKSIGSPTPPSRLESPTEESEDDEKSKDLPSAPTTAVNGALEWSRSKISTMLSPETAGDRRDAARDKRDAADEAEKLYKVAISELDLIRQALECLLADSFSYLERIELDRIKAVDSVLKAYATTLLNSVTATKLSIENAKSMQFTSPSKDIMQIIEELKTGPFVPSVYAFHSVYQEPEPRFGLDLSKWEETKGDSTSVPAVLTLLLDHLTSHSSKSPAKTQNSWILEAPLSSIHHLRNSLNSSTSLDQIDLERYDLPIVTGAVKEWFLELNVIPFPLYAEISKVYPRGAAIENKMELLSGILSKLPSVNLQVLNTFIKYLSQLIASVVVEEQQTFLLKLSLTLASCIARPATYNSLTLQDKFPSTLLIDLISNVSILEKLTEESQKKKDERYKPRRQRTRPLDKRRFRTASSLASEPAILPTESPTSTATVELLSPPKPSAVVVPVPVEMETAKPPKPLAVVVPVPIETKIVTVTAAAIETLQEESQPLKSSLSRSKRASLRGPRSQRNELIKDEENNELVKEEDSSEEFKECE